MPATNFSEMPILGPTRPADSPSFHRRRKSWARRLERCCCTTFSYFPLAFIYGLTTWAVVVQVSVSFLERHDWVAFSKAGAGLALYLLADGSYTIAVFTSPGSPLDRRSDSGRIGRRKDGGYEGLPLHDDDDSESTDRAVPSEWMSTVTAKSTGKPRYCKKCRSVKPDRSHHCSTCGRCVLKMDHHCPWLATCVGFRNYKAFLLFLIYLSLFCWVCFACTATWVWAEIKDSRAMSEGLFVVHVIMLAVLGGIIGIVISGFTAWHIYLTFTGQTTIESLEKTRYLAPIRRSLQNRSQQGRNFMNEGGEDGGSSISDEDQPLGERLKSIHANALPEVLRPEEGELSFEPDGVDVPLRPGAAGHDSGAAASLHRSFASLEAQRERDRYNLYLDEQDSEKMPNAFDNGWRRNLRQVFGERPLLWWLPVCNSIGDGWLWEVSSKWTEARDRIGREREHRERANAAWDRHPQREFGHPGQQPNWRWNGAAGFVDVSEGSFPRGANPVSQPLPPPPRGSSRSAGNQTQLPSDEQGLSASSGEVDGPRLASGANASSERRTISSLEPTANWNDIPDGFLSQPSSSPDLSRDRRKGD